jgi:ATP-dependent Clp protease ATP-binding subunit ClpB
MTSNLGSEYLLNNDREKVNELLRMTFRPEFLNRIDEIVYFSPLGKEVQVRIVDKMLNELANRLLTQYISVSFTDALKNYIINEAYSFEYGARPIKRFIQRDIETIIARAIIAGTIDTSRKFVIDYKDEKLLIS